MAANDDRDYDTRDDIRPRERSRSTARDRSRPHRDTSGHRSRSNLGTVVRDVDRLAYSLTRASARAYFGTVGAIGDLVVNLADSIYSSPYGDRRRDHDPDDRDYRDRGDTRDRDRGRDTRRSRDSGANRARSFGADVSSSLSQAIRDTADVLSDSVREFDDVFHDEQERDDEIDERVAAAEDDVAQSRGERARPRARPSAPPESKET